MLVEIASGTTVDSIETMGRQWNVFVGYRGQKAFVLKARAIYPFGEWVVEGQFDDWRQAHDAMLEAYNRANGHSGPKAEAA
jgi:hypothetical protein